MKNNPELAGAVWRKSAHSGGDNSSCVEVASFWRKSTHSGADESSCVEVASAWRKSAHSGGDEGDCVEVTSLWRKSVHSGADEGNCVEVAQGDQLVAVRDSKNPGGDVLAFGRAEWRALLGVLKG